MTLEEIAAELGLGETTVRRVLDTVLEKLRVGLDLDVDLEHFSGEIAAYYEIPRRFREKSRDKSNGDLARDSELSPPVPCRVAIEARAGSHLPRRFKP